MRKNLMIIITLGLCNFLTAQSALEQWQDYLPSTGTHTVVQGNNQIFCANLHMVFSYNLLDNSLEVATKVNQLSDVGISAIGFDNASGTLIVGYETGNLDLIRNGKTFNLNAIQTSSLFGVKRINHIYPESGRAYISTGFGIVYIDLQNEEVIDTYIIGPGGANLQINSVVKHNGNIYAATDIGLFHADAGNTFLANFSNWSLIDTYPAFNQIVTDVVSFGDYVVFMQKNTENEDKVYYSNNDEDWSLLWENEDLRGLDVSQSKLAVKDLFSVEVFSSDLQQAYTIEFGLWPTFRLRCNSLVIISDSEVWLGDERYGLRKYNPQTTALESIRPVGPDHVDGFRIQFIENALFKCSGGPAANWTPTFNPNGLEVYKNDRWSTYDNGSAYILENNIRDFMVVAVHPDNEKHWYVGTWTSGILEFMNGEIINQFTEINSTLTGSSATGGPAVAGLKFDDDKNLWITNAYTNTPVQVLDTEGEWHAFSASNAGATGSDLFGDITIAQSGYKWIVRPRGNGIVVYDDNNTVDDSSDDRAISLSNQAGQGNLPTMDVFAIAEDINGEIWVGTGEGIAVFYTPGSVFSNNNFDAQQILIEQDGNIQILLETELVQSIAVDGANRKWLGTAGSGAFLMSPDGTEQIYHFTSANSPLPSNNVGSIAINGETGEVFFATDMGMVSFKGTATDGLTANTCRKVYPNPVRPGYEGPIAIEGLERNTNVKITDVAGNLVFETTSEGGQAMWNGRNVRGIPVTTGVYTALCVAPEANSSCVAKIMVIR